MSIEPKPPRKLRPLRPIQGAQPAAPRARRPVDPAAHERRLEDLRRRIADGTYQPDPEAIVREILKRGLDAER